MVLKHGFSRDHGIVWRAERSCRTFQLGTVHRLFVWFGALGGLECFGWLIEPVVIQAEVLEPL